MYEEVENRVTIQVATCHSSIEEIIKPAEKVIGDIIDMCKEATETMIDAKNQSEKLEIYEEMKDQLNDIDRRLSGKPLKSLIKLIEERAIENLDMCADLRLW